MKKFRIVIFLFAIILSISCTQKVRTEDQLYKNRNNDETYDNSTGEKYNGVEKVDGPLGRKVENVFKDGKCVETSYKDPDGSTANFKYDSQGNQTSETYKNSSGQSISSEEFENNLHKH